MNQYRTPADVPSGGQFAEQAKKEATKVALAAEEADLAACFGAHTTLKRASEYPTYEAGQEVVWTDPAGGATRLGAMSRYHEVGADAEDPEADDMLIVEFPDGGETEVLRHEIQPTGQQPCYHPLSCRRCDATGGACGEHLAGTRGHQRCTGRGA